MANDKGRDFVVGDIHGAWVALCRGLEDVSFDTSKDRLFSVGDLVDRGPHSFQTLSLLKESWFFPVLGNHEAMLLTWLDARVSDYHSGPDFLKNGGEWILGLAYAQRRTLLDDYLPRLLQTPYLRRVEDPLVPFYVVHAQRVWRQGAEVLQARGLQDFLKSNRWPTIVTWGRQLKAEVAGAFDCSMHTAYGVRTSPHPLWEGVELTYCGHTIHPEPILHASHLHLDTGMYREHLTPARLFNHRDWVGKLSRRVN